MRQRFDDEKPFKSGTCAASQVANSCTIPLPHPASETLRDRWAPTAQYVSISATLTASNALSLARLDDPENLRKLGGVLHSLHAHVYLSNPRLSFTAEVKSCSAPRYRSVV
jgi:hypothetical protein